MCYFSHLDILRKYRLLGPFVSIVYFRFCIAFQLWVLLTVSKKERQPKIDLFKILLHQRAFSDLIQSARSFLGVVHYFNISASDSRTISNLFFPFPLFMHYVVTLTAFTLIIIFTHYFDMFIYS